MKVRFFTKIAVLVLALAAGNAVFAQASWPCGATANDKVTATLNADGVLTIRGTGNMIDGKIAVKKVTKPMGYESAVRACEERYECCMTGLGCGLIDVERVFGEPSATRCKRRLESCVTDKMAGKESTEIKEIPMPWVEYSDGITKVVIENGVTHIGNEAFVRMKGLNSVIIGNSVRSIGYGAFAYDTNITSLTIGNGVLLIGALAFKNCAGLSSVAIPNNVKTIGNEAFSGCSGLLSVTMPNGVTSIESRAFWGCSRLTSITIPNSVTSIGAGTFGNCRRLTTIDISNNVTSVESGTFSGCTGLTSVVIPNGVQSVEGGAFYGCTNLTSLTIGKSVTIIKNRMFGIKLFGEETDCPRSITFITMLNPTPPPINAETFTCVDKKTCILYVPEGSLYKLANIWKNFVNIKFGSGPTEAELRQAKTGIGYGSGFGSGGGGVDDMLYGLMGGGGGLELKKKDEMRSTSTDYVRGGAMTGGRSRVDIQRGVMQNMAALRYAYSTRLREKPGLSGKITVTFAIDEYGKVISARVNESTLGDSELENTVVNRVKSWTFEKINKPGDVTTVTYPFVFSE